MASTDELVGLVLEIRGYDRRLQVLASRRDERARALEVEIGRMRRVAVRRLHAAKARR